MWTLQCTEHEWTFFQWERFARLLSRSPSLSNKVLRSTSSTFLAWLTRLFLLQCIFAAISLSLSHLWSEFYAEKVKGKRKPNNHPIGNRANLQPQFSKQWIFCLLCEYLKKIERERESVLAKKKSLRKFFRLLMLRKTDGEKWKRRRKRRERSQWQLSIANDKRHARPHVQPSHAQYGHFQAHLLPANMIAILFPPSLRPFLLCISV